MKKFLFALLSLPLLSIGQNGGQFEENNVAKVQFGGSLITATFMVISKQNCTANYKVDYGTVEVVSIAAFDTAIFNVPLTTTTFKAKAESQTTCINQPDMGWVEIILDDLFTLPVKLISFNGTQKEGRVVLTWEVMNETVSMFEVERSTDGRSFAAFEMVSKVPGFGSKGYSATDNLNGITYYRLKMWDDRLRSEYSRAIAFRGSLAYKFKMYSNPIADRILFSIVAAKDERIKVKLIDAQGRILLNTSVNVAVGENLVDVPIGSLLSGVYAVVIVTEGGVFTEKLVKQ